MTEADARTTTSISDARWCDIERTIPATADKVYVRAELERIAQTKMPPKQLADQQEAIARRCGDLRALLKAEPFQAEPREQRLAFLEELSRRGEAAKKQAAVYRRIGKVKRPHFASQCQLLWLYEQSGGDPHNYVEPHRREQEFEWEEGRSPERRGRDPPRAPVILYFQAAALAVFGKTPKSDHVKKVVIAYNHLNFSAAEKMTGAGGMAIDEAKIGILRDGKLI
jgi:hypothetical protein